MKCLIVLPCYNEEENVESLIYKIDQFLNHFIQYEIVAINDGSRDHTGDLLKHLSNNYPIMIKEHIENRGLSEALRTGLKAALQYSSDEDFIVTMDSDNTHDPKYILPMLESGRSGADIVIGSRYVSKGKQLNVSPHRVLLSRSINLLIRKIVKLPVRDVTSGYRCFKAFVLRRLREKLGKEFLTSKGFEVSLELLIKTFWCCSKVKEIPITLDYGKKKGKSKMRLIPTINSYIIALMKIKDWKEQLVVAS